MKVQFYRCSCSETEKFSIFFELLIRLVYVVRTLLQNDSSIIFRKTSTSVYVQNSIVQKLVLQIVTKCRFLYCVCSFLIKNLLLYALIAEKCYNRMVYVINCLKNNTSFLVLRVFVQKPEIKIIEKFRFKSAKVILFNYTFHYILGDPPVVQFQHLKRGEIAQNF